MLQILPKDSTTRDKEEDLKILHDDKIETSINVENSFITSK